ncbi:hypothetical protein [Streptomyces oryzae]|nr:hypothetical protein [Streptomyces oryzae]
MSTTLGVATLAYMPYAFLKCPRRRTKWSSSDCRSSAGQAG